MLRFANVGLTASKMISFQCERGFGFIWPHQSRRYMSDDDYARHRREVTFEACKKTIAQGDLTEGIISINISTFYIIIFIYLFHIIVTVIFCLLSNSFEG